MASFILATSINCSLMKVEFANVAKFILEYYPTITRIEFDLSVRFSKYISSL
jgi:hypothetical protein